MVPPTDMAPRPDGGPVVALSGGIGGAKLALGLYRVLGPDRLTVIANCGDDFEHLGLHVSPDLDTLMYTLAGLANQEAGWGRAGETWTFMTALEALGGETWFRLGDGDLATHLERTRRLQAGESLTRITADFAQRLGIRARLVPMSDDRVPTVVETSQGRLPFQRYFVEQGSAPAAKGFVYQGAAAARPGPAALDALGLPGLRTVVICPSNPFLSIDPILALPAVRAALAACSAPVIAVSPIVGGAAVKGPTAKIMRELGLPPTPATIARHYGSLLDGFVLDEQDAAEAAEVPMPTLVTRTLMDTLAARDSLARDVLAFAMRLAAVDA